MGGYLLVASGWTGHYGGTCLYGVPRVTSDRHRVMDSSGHCWWDRGRLLVLSAMDIFTLI